MWISLKDSDINFDLILRFKREDRTIVLTDIMKNTTILYYSSPSKAENVIKYLRSELKTKLGYSEENKET